MKRLIYILIFFLLLSCNEDVGTYDYSEINVVAVGLDEVYPFRLDKDTTVIIMPRLSQSLQDNKDNLRYVWLYSTTNHNFYGHKKFDTVSQDESMHFHIKPEEKNLKYDHYFRLNVYDELTGIEYPMNTTIKLVKPYDGAWMVLQNKNEQAVLGSVEYIAGKIVTTEDAYFRETGKNFHGRPLCLGQFTTSCKYYGTGSSWNMFSVITDDPYEAGVYCQWKKFEKKDSLIRMVAPVAQADFNFQGVTCIDGQGSYGAFLLSGGIFYQSPRAMKVYKANCGLAGDVKITHATKVSPISLVYDEKGHRFGYYYNNSSGSGTLKYDPKYFTEGEENIPYVIKPIPLRDNNVLQVDPNKLDQGEKMLYLGTGYHFDPTQWARVYGVALTLKGVECYVYEFGSRGIYSTSGGDPAFAGYYQISTPRGLNENSCFASSLDYSGILFYASGNTVYRLDYKQAGGKAIPIYTHVGGSAIKMKFAESKTSGAGKYEAYEFDVSRSLGVAFDMGSGKSDFVILNLSTTGSIGTDSERYPAKQIHSGFSKITDFVFL